jgi:hypothetical protein
MVEKICHICRCSLINDKSCDNAWRYIYIFALGYEPDMFVYENSRTSMLISILLIPTISLYSCSDTRGDVLDLYENMQTEAAVGLGMPTSSTWTTLETRTTMAHNKVPSAAFSECNLLVPFHVSS